jgi:hypothetical protein
MAPSSSNRPAEIFGYPIDDRTEEAQRIRARHWCPFVNQVCNKKSRLIDYPFGVCSAEHQGRINTLCPRRFEERGSIEGIPRVLEDLALHYFGTFNNVIPFPEVKLPKIGSIDYVLVKHKPMKAEVEDFVAVEFQADSTTGTGGLVQGIRDFLAGQSIEERSYRFGMNTYDTIKRSITQLLNKGIVYEAWGMKGYWVIQEYIYANLVNRYGLKQEGYSQEQASRFALYNFKREGDHLNLVLSRYVSTSVDEVYQAMRNNRSLPSKDRFVNALNTKLRAKLTIKFD